MDTRTGEIRDWNEVERLAPEERKHFVEVKRDLSKREDQTRQIRMYAPCACGSGKKFKFCCFKKP